MWRWGPSRQGTVPEQLQCNFVSHLGVGKLWTSAVGIAEGFQETCSNSKLISSAVWMRWAGHVARMGEERGVYRVLVGKPEGKRPLGRPRRRWVDNIRMDLQEVGCGHVDWIGLAQDRDRWRTLVSAVMNLWVPWNAGNFLTSCKPVSCSARTLHHGVSK